MHLTLRGHDRQPIFVGSMDRHVLLRYLVQALESRSVALHAYVLMDNHVHLLATAGEERAISHFMQAWSRRYAFYVNRSNTRCGSLYDGRFRSSPVKHDRHFVACMRYIELNPVRAGICNHPAKFEWSSYAENASGRPGAPIVPHELYLELGRDDSLRGFEYRRLFGRAISTEEIEGFRGPPLRARGRPKNVPGTCSVELPLE